MGNEATDEDSLPTLLCICDFQNKWINILKEAQKETTINENIQKEPNINKCKSNMYEMFLFLLQLVNQIGFQANEKLTK